MGDSYLGITFVQPAQCKPANRLNVAHTTVGKFPFVFIEYSDTDKLGSFISNTNS